MSAKKKIVYHKLTGTVMCYNARLGFGFINRDDTEEDICFHEAALKDNPKKAINSINEGEVIQFDIVVGENGNEVANVTGPNGAVVGESPHVADVVARRVTGIVTRYEVRLGHGYIARDDNDEFVFVHQSDIVMDGFRSLCVGEVVEFDIAVGRTKAIFVTGPNRAPVKGTLNALRKWRETQKKEDSCGDKPHHDSRSMRYIQDWLELIKRDFPEDNNNEGSSSKLMEEMEVAKSVCCPRVQSQCGVRRREPWFTKGLMTSRKRNNKLARKAKQKGGDHKVKYTSYKRIYNKLCRAAKQKYYDPARILHLTCWNEFD